MKGYFLLEVDGSEEVVRSFLPQFNLIMDRLMSISPVFKDVRIKMVEVVKGDVVDGFGEYFCR